MTESMEATETDVSVKTRETDVSDLVEQLSKLEEQNRELSRRLHEAERRSPPKIAYYLTFIGASVLSVSVYLNSLILNIIGLGILLPGVILIAIRPGERGDRSIATGLVEATSISSLKALDRLLAALDYRGKPVYLPPPNSNNPAEAKVFIPDAPGNHFPPETEMVGGNLVTSSPRGLSLTPPGKGLADLIEEKLGASFGGVDLDYLRSHLPRLLSKGLGLTKGFHLEQLDSNAYIRIEGSALAPLCATVERETGLCGTLGCPLTSAIAIILAKTTHKPVTIDAVEISNEGKTVEAWYGIMKGMNTAPAGP